MSRRHASQCLQKSLDCPFEVNRTRQASLSRFLWKTLGKFRWPRWPYPAKICKILDVTQRRFLMHLFPVPRRPDDILDSFFPRRHLESIRLQRQSGPWSEQVAKSFFFLAPAHPPSSRPELLESRSRRLARPAVAAGTPCRPLHSRRTSPPRPVCYGWARPTMGRGTAACQRRLRLAMAGCHPHPSVLECCSGNVVAPGVSAERRPPTF